MSDFFKVVRYKNLLFIALVQVVMQQTVLMPIMQIFGFNAPFDSGLMVLLVLGTLLIAAGGYVLNDYFDIKIDSINRPDKQIVGVSISRQQAMLMHQVLTGLGVLIGLVLAVLTRSFTLALIFIVIPGLLWFYSASYKRQFIIGNIVVAFIASMAVLIVGITQLAVLKKEYGETIFETPIPHQLYAWIGGFAVFCFLCTWIREIIKDIEDEQGDREMECRTMPIKWGVNKTKWFLYGLISITVISLLLANALFIPFEGTLTLRFIIVGVSLPLLVVAYLLFSARKPEEYHQAAVLLKIIMLVGVLYGFLFYYLQAKTVGISIFNLFVVQGFPVKTF